MAGLWAKVTWQLIVGLLGMVGSNWGAIDVILRIDAINRRAEVHARGNAR